MWNALNVTLLRCAGCDERGVRVAKPGRGSRVFDFVGYRALRPLDCSLLLRGEESETKNKEASSQT